MSLITDLFFFDTISSSDDITTLVGTRIYNPAVPVPDADLVKVDVPYIVILPEGTDNDETTKDDLSESYDDIDTVSILIVAASREDLAKLANHIRKSIREAFSTYNEDGKEANYGFQIVDYHFSASRVVMDVEKPCVYQQFKYICNTHNIS